MSSPSVLLCIDLLRDGGTDMLLDRCINGCGDSAIRIDRLCVPELFL